MMTRNSHLFFVMTVSYSDTSDSRVAFLTEQWKTTSLAGGWLHPGDWYAVAARGVVRAVVQSGEVVSAASELGAERANQGVGITEALRDLAVFFELLGEQPPVDVTTGFVAGWVEVSTESLLHKSTVEPLTGLLTIDYLLPRLRELYAEAGRGHRPQVERCIIVVDRCENAPSGWRGVRHDARVGRVLNSVLDSGETNSMLPSGVLVSLAFRDDALDEYLVRIQRALSDDSGDVIAVHVEALPATLAEAERLILSL